MTSAMAGRRLRESLFIAREALSHADTRRAALRDIGPRHTISSDELHLTAAVDWLCRAHDACPGSGISYGYDLRKGWMAAYPEITGYTIPTLFEYAKGRQHSVAAALRDRAGALAGWLLSVQLPSGAIQAGTTLLEPHPTVFNTGQVLDGWCRTHDEIDVPGILPAIDRAASWMTSIQDDDGCWRRGLSPLTPKTPATYNVRSAAILFQAGQRLDKPSWRDAAVRNGDWVLTRQQSNGWFADNCVSDNSRPLTHTIGYTLEGLLELGHQSQSDRFIAAVERASDALLPCVNEDGSLAGRFDTEWRPAVRWNCLTGACQIAMVWCRLARHTGRPEYAGAARRVLDFVKRTQLIDPATAPGVAGGIKGSHPVWGRYEPYSYPSWATKFFVDALMESAGRGAI
jgi:hypothetical protein